MLFHSRALSLACIAATLLACGGDEADVSDSADGNDIRDNDVDDGNDSADSDDIKDDDDANDVDDGNDGNDISDSDDGGSDTDNNPTTCSADGTGVQFVLDGAFQGSATSVTFVRDLPEDSPPRIIGFQGTTARGEAFTFRRDGDFSDGDLEDLRSYDVSNYPYNILYFEGPVGADCEDGGGCSGFLAVAGSFVVEAVHPVYKATFQLSSLQESEGDGGGADIVGAVTGCLAVPNP